VKIACFLYKIDRHRGHRFSSVNKMACSLPFSKLSLLLLFASLSFSYATSRHPAFPPQSSKAERLIRSFNLFPKEPFNTIQELHHLHTFVPGQIVETNFSFLGASGPPVEDLGHHAGYYSLPHSKAAR